MSNPLESQCIECNRTDNVAFMHHQGDDDFLCNVCYHIELADYEETKRAIVREENARQ